MSEPKCFACDRPFRTAAVRALASTSDGQTVYVGPECYRHVIACEADGYQPPKGGPRLYELRYVDGADAKGGA